MSAETENVPAPEASPPVAGPSESPARGSQLLHALSAVCFLGVVVLAWFWPVTVLNRVPVGIEVSSFYLPLMHYYSGALAERRVPLWNEQWGFGAPALAASEMGVFYPLHLVTYGLLRAADAYRFNLVLHSILSAWLAYACARGFGLSRRGACLAGLVFAGQGFFIVQSPRPWSYLAGCWLPLAVHFTWRWLDGGARGGRVRWGHMLGLPLVLAVQLLAGHFQVAFFTHVTLLLLCVAAIGCCADRRWQVARRSVAVLLAQAGALALAAVQMVPSAELAVRSDPRGHTWQELGKSANPPAHLISYLAPTLLHRNPLWEPIAWEPSHSSPRECLNYVGLIPLCLSLGAVAFVRREPAVRIWCLLAAVSVALSFGPYFAGFRWLVRVPGFDWCFAPARWSIVTGLFLGLLAGRGLDALAPGVWRRWSWRLVVGAVTVLGLVCALCVAASRGSLGRWLDESSTRLSPWSGPAWSKKFDEPPDSRLRRKMLDHGYLPAELNTTPAREMRRMLLDGLPVPAANLLALGLLGLLNTSKRWTVPLLVVWTAIDLGVAAYLLRGVEFQKCEPLARRSPVLARLAAAAPQRVAGPVKQLAMAVGAAPLPDTPVPGVSRFWDRGARLTVSKAPFDHDDVQFLRFNDIRYLVRRPDFEPPEREVGLRLVAELDDPWLSALVLGTGYVRFPGPGASRWTIWKPPPGGRAWVFPLPDAGSPGTDPRELRWLPPAQRKILDTEAARAECVIPNGERLQVTGSTDRPAVLVVADAYYPGWRARLTQQGTSRPVPIVPAFGAWRAVELPEAGSFEVTMEYRPESFRLGVCISLGAAAFWLIAAALSFMLRIPDSFRAG